MGNFECVKTGIIIDESKLTQYTKTFPVYVRGNGQTVKLMNIVDQRIQG